MYYRPMIRKKQKKRGEAEKGELNEGQWGKKKFSLEPWYLFLKKHQLIEGGSPGKGKGASSGGLAPLYTVFSKEGPIVQAGPGGVEEGQGT